MDYGPLGVLVIVVGIGMFFVCDAKIISDKNYDNYIIDLVKSGETDSSHKVFEYSFEGYSEINASNIKICHDIVRTDQYVITGINIKAGYINLESDEVNIDGDMNHKKMKLKLGEIYALSLEENNIGYISLCSNDKEELVKFPVQKNDIIVEQFCDYVNKFAKKVTN